MFSYVMILLTLGYDHNVIGENGKGFIWMQNEDDEEDEEIIPSLTGLYKSLLSEIIIKIIHKILDKAKHFIVSVA